MATLNTDERNLILVQGLYFLGDALAGIFVTVFIFAHTDFQTVLFYTSLNFVGLLAFYILSGKVMEKISSGVLVRIGLGLNALYYFLLFLLKDQAIVYLVPLALLDGAAAGNFWAGLNLNQYVYSQHHTRVQYFGTQYVINNGIRAAGPIIGGALITWFGSAAFIGFNTAYAALFFITSLVYLSAAVFIGKLPQHELLRFSFGKFLTHKRSNAWKRVLWQHAVYGCFDVLSGTMIPILMFTVLRQEFLLGSAQTVLAIVMMGGAWFATRLLKQIRGAFWIGSVGVSLGFIGFAAFPDLRGVWMFIILYGVAASFLPTWLLTEWFHTLDRAKFDWRENFHVLIERDIALGIPRIVSYFVLIFFVRQGNQVGLAWNSLYMLPVFPVVLGILFTIHQEREAEIVPGSSIGE